MDVVENNFGIEAFGVLLHALHQHGTRQAFDVTGPVIDVRGGHQLTASLHSGDDHGFQVGAGGIYCGGITGGAGAENNHTAVLGSGHLNSLWTNEIVLAGFKKTPIVMRISANDYMALLWIITTALILVH